MSKYKTPYEFVSGPGYPVVSAPYVGVSYKGTTRLDKALEKIAEQGGDVLVDGTYVVKSDENVISLSDSAKESLNKADTALQFEQYTGTVTQVKVGSASYNPSSGVVSLPAYPTTLPASDVSAWAKASSKPTYTASEVNAIGSEDFYSQCGGKNLLDFANLVYVKAGPCTYSKSDEDITVTSTGIWSYVSYKLDGFEADKSYDVSFKISNISKSGGIMKLWISESSGGGNKIKDISFSTNGTYTFSFTAKSTMYLLFYPNYSSTSYRNSCTFSEIMIKPSGVGNSDYIKYIPTNSELYEMIKALMQQ